MRLYLIATIVLLSLCFSASSTSAQILDITNSTSVPIPGVGHDYIHLYSETVDPANGSVSLRISVPVPPGRGLTLPFSFAYDSQGVYLPSKIGTGLGSNNFDYLAQAGWSYTIPRFNTRSNEIMVQNGVSPHDATCTYTSNFTFQDATGGRHSLGLFTKGVSPPAPAVCTGAVPWTQILAAGDIAFRASTTSSSNLATVADADGTVYSEVSTNGLVDLIEDRNGNKLAIKDLGNHAFAVTDDLGRSLLSSTGFGQPGGDAVTVSGLSKPYEISWESVPSHFSTTWNLLTPGACGSAGGPIADTTTWTAVQAITLPNGQQYTFNYDDGTTGTHYGLVNKITYPYRWIRELHVGAKHTVGNHLPNNHRPAGGKRHDYVPLSV